MVAKILLLTVLLVSGASCWWDGGHMLTAEIAKQEIIARDPALFAKIDKFITMLSPFCDKRSQDFIQSASWLDDIKDPAMSFWYDWHFFDKPENPQGLYIQQSADGLVNNSINAVKRAVQELSMKYFNPTMNADGVSIQKGIFMRILIHVVGDMHQPLHNVNMYNNTYANGDMGGNYEKIILLNGTAMNMHSYFDSGALRLASFQRPLNQQNLTAIEQLGSTYRMMHPRTLFGAKINITDPLLWTQESFDIAHNVIYPYIATTNKVTTSFDNEMYQMIMRQITLGGYRLADTLLRIFDPTYTPKPAAAQTTEQSFVEQQLANLGI